MRSLLSEGWDRKRKYEWGKRRRPEHESPRGDPCEDFGARGSSGKAALPRSIGRSPLVIPFDLLVHYGDAEGQGKDSFRVGIVVYAPDAGRPAAGADPAEYLKRVVVVGANEGDRQVTLSTWVSNGTTRGFTEDGSGAHLCRLVATAAPVQARALRAARAANARASASAPSTKVKVIIDSEVAFVKFAYSASYEATSPDKAKAWRWIPNTGEYLVLGQLSLVTTNQEGKPLDFAAISECSVRLEAWDRAFIAGEAASNIRANKGTGFEIACSKTGNFATAQPVSAYKLTRGDTAAYAVADFSSSQSSSLVVDSKGRITVTLHTPGGDIPGYQFFAIRPLAGSIRPGDDLILGVQLGYTSTKTHFLFWEKRSYNETDLGADDSKYLAVYDKKMLWRANLYIAETANDWNDQHPWNAPPGDPSIATNVPVDKVPVWWSKDWGYNEWNRRMKFSPEFMAGKNVGLANLPAGDGKQVVDIPAFTPLRTLPRGQAPGESNTLGGTVAYSYPQHDYEPIKLPQNPTAEDLKHRQDGDSGSQDSPFDFLWKMLKQKTSLSTAYDTDGIAKTQNSTTSWSWTKAPKNSWKNYSPGTSEVPGYVPSLGLWYRDCDNNTDVDESGISGLAWSQPYIYEAGTDCIGFAQRAASWMFSSGSYNSYKWHSLLPGFMEFNDGKGTSNPDDIYTASAASKRQYPIDENDSALASTVATRIVTVFVNEKATSSNAPMPSIEELRRIVPGDVFVKDSASLAETKMNDHIAIVAYVPDDPSITDPADFMSKIMLIEAEYTNKIQSVIKKLSVGMYNDNLVPKGTIIYSNFNAPIVGSAQGIPLNCQSWAIRRLK